MIYRVIERAAGEHVAYMEIEDYIALGMHYCLLYLLARLSHGMQIRNM